MTEWNETKESQVTTLGKTLALSAVLAVAVALFGSLTTTAHAQEIGGYTAYGSGTTAGYVVEAYRGDALCGSATADADGNWGPINLNPSDDCAWADGDTITFHVGGMMAMETATWTAAGYPADITAGIVFAPMMGETETETEPEMVVPDPSDTGSAGLAQSTGANSIAVLLLAALAATVVAGGRVLGSRTR
jgi:hypothetical protein